MSEPPDPSENSPGIAIGYLALKRGFITPEQLREALSDQSGGQLLDAILLRKGFLTQSQLTLLQSIRETQTGQPPAAAAEAPGLGMIGKYRLVREAGRGAMAKVYEAVDPELERTVALKMLFTSPNAHPEEAKIEDERFLREARLCAKLPKHPHIIGIYDAGVVDGRRYLAMEFVQGLAMDAWMKRGSVSVGRPTTLLRDVALAVHHAHEHGIIHRDLKPANILVDGDNHPHIMDFGLAKMAGQSITASYTEAGLAVGTPAYMSPEQASGVKTVDRRTDIYSMGVMLYEILTGRLPFVGSSPAETMLKTTKDAVVPPSKITSVQIRPEHFKTLEGVCLKALAKDPAERYSTAEAFATDLTRWLRGQDFKVSNLRKRTVVLALAGIAAAALIAVGLYPRPTPIAPVKTLPAPVAQVPADPWAAAVELLSAVDLTKHVVSGIWKLERGAVVSYEGKPARLQIPYHPPEEYDLRVVFARHQSNFCVDLIVSQGGRPFTLVLQKQGFFGFERIQGADFHKNASTWRHEGGALEAGRDYTVLVEVRKTGVQAYFDGKPISRLAGYEDIAMNPDWKLPDTSAIGVGTWDGGAEIRRLDLREVTGRGLLIPVSIRRDQ